VLFKIFLSKIIPLATILCILYLVISVGLSSFSVGKRYVLSASDEYDVIYDRAGKNPYAYEKLAIRQIEEGHYALAESNLLQSVALDPTHGQVASLLAFLYDQKAHDKADLAFRKANQLWPAYSKVRSLSANYWLKEENYESLLQDWNVLLIRIPETRKHIFPILEQLMLTVDIQNLFEPYINTPPVWWDDYFRYLSNKENASTLINSLYSLRLASKAEILEEERKIYVNLLLKKKRWNEAYFSWLGGIGDEVRYANNYIFDGGFESKLLRTGFSWNFWGDNKIYRISIDNMPGIGGLKALHIDFLQNKRINFKNVWQRVMLSPGHYKVNFKTRLVNLHATKGLSWRIRCLVKENSILGESSALKGSSHWENRSFSVSIPDDCPVQILRLETVSPYAHDQIFRGQMWFDDFSIEKVVGETNE
jgi:hypothetical protein